MGLFVLSGCNFYFDVDSVSQPEELGPNDAGDVEVDDTCCTSDASDGGGDVADTTDATDASSDATDTPDGDDVSDVTDTGDADDVEPGDAGDEGDVGDAGDATDSGRTCPADQGTPVGICDPVAQQGCPTDKFCTLALILSGGVPERFEARCDSDANAGNGAEGESCISAANCGVGLYCVNWEAPEPRGKVCSRFCDRRTGDGCGPDEFCTNPTGDLLDGLGFCTPRCDPNDSASCGSDQVCAPDPYYSQDTCLANFRCLHNGGDSGKSEGDSCSPDNLHNDGCPSDFICGVDPRDSTAFACLTPCSTSSDCAGASCVSASSPWSSFRHCEI